MEHVWRVFEGDKEYIVKHLDLRTPVTSEKDENGHDYNIVCSGTLVLDREKSIAKIEKSTDSEIISFPLNDEFSEE